MEDTESRREYNQELSKELSEISDTALNEANLSANYYIRAEQHRQERYVERVVRKKLIKVLTGTLARLQSDFPMNVSRQGEDVDSWRAMLLFLERSYMDTLIDTKDEEGV